MDPTREIVLAGHRGDAHTARAALDDPEPAMRSAALGALARMGTLECSELQAASSDQDRTVRRRAATVAPRAFRSGDPCATAVLVELLDDDEWTVVDSAAWALGELISAGTIDEPVDAEPGPARHDGSERQQRDRAIASLEGVATHHGDPMCRESAVAALGAIGSTSSLDAVLVACGDRANVRRRAVLALAAFDDPRASQMLRDLADDRDLQVSQAAEDLLAIEDGEAT